MRIARIGLPVFQWQQDLKTLFWKILQETWFSPE